MEGAEGFRSIDELEEFYELGLRQVGPVWAGMRYCGGSKESRSFDSEGYDSAGHHRFTWAWEWISAI